VERVLRGQTGILWDLWNILGTSNVLPFDEDKLMARHGVGTGKQRRLRKGCVYVLPDQILSLPATTREWIVNNFCEKNL
jgi:hypothetical protein